MEEEIQRVIDFVSGKKQRYERRGDCIRCGVCCREEECEHLKIENGLATCKIYDSPDRPLKCKLFPEMPPIPKKFKNCGYYFLDAWENNKIVKWRVT